MQISEYQPPPPRPFPPEPPRKNRSRFIMGALLLLVFLGTLAVESRHEIAEHFRHEADAPSALTETAKQPPTVPTPPVPAQQSAANTPPLPPQTSQAAENSPFK